MKNTRWNRLECTIALTLFFVLCYAAFCDTSQQKLADDVLRLRVVAASDRAEDQHIKLCVRDQILEILQPLRKQAASRDEMEQLVAQNMDAIITAAQQTVNSFGAQDTVSATLRTEWYPTREYDTFALPSGLYTGLQVRIGAADGHNWWCVLYPSLCTGAAEEQYLSEDECNLIHRSDTGYELRFRTAELLGSLRGWIYEERMKE